MVIEEISNITCGEVGSHCDAFTLKLREFFLGPFVWFKFRELQGLSDGESFPSWSLRFEIGRVKYLVCENNAANSFLVLASFSGSRYFVGVGHSNLIGLIRNICKYLPLRVQ